MPVVNRHVQGEENADDVSTVTPGYSVRVQASKSTAPESKERGLLFPRITLAPATHPWTRTSPVVSSGNLLFLGTVRSGGPVGSLSG